MLTVADLCGRGLLPAELPPPFQSGSLGPHATALAQRQAQMPEFALPRHNLFRWGTLRRELGIPNPVPYARTALVLEQNVLSLQPVLGLAKHSGALSQPVHGAFRAMERQHTHDDAIARRINLRAGARYAVRADVSRFYHSIYTHSVEWAIHTKQAAKANLQRPQAQRQRFWGGMLDVELRRLQRAQSIGIPIGPDVSLVIAETLLSRVDSLLAPTLTRPWMRYLDDYEFSFPTHAEAETGLHRLEAALAEYELAVNPLKTEIVELPTPLEERWVHELRKVRLRNTAQLRDICAAFDLGSNILPETGTSTCCAF